MNRKIALVISFFMVTGAVFFSTAVFASHKGGKVHKLALHINRTDKGSVNMTINNARNVTKYYGVGNVEIEIVAYGPGLKLLYKGSKVADRLRGLHALGNIKFGVCKNTMNNFKVTKADLLQDSFIQDAIVPSGVVRLIELQEQGWSYVKP